MSGPGDEVPTNAIRIEAYLRNELSGADRAEFERDMLRDPALHAEVELRRAARGVPAPERPPGMGPTSQTKGDLLASWASDQSESVYSGESRRLPGDR